MIKILFITAFILSTDFCIGQCNGSAACRVCTNCSRCRFCKAGGLCGVCSGGSPRSGIKPAGRTRRLSVNNISKQESDRTDNSIADYQSITSFSGYPKRIIIQIPKANVKNSTSPTGEIVATLPAGFEIIAIGESKGFYIFENRGKQLFINKNYF